VRAEARSAGAVAVPGSALLAAIIVTALLALAPPAPASAQRPGSRPGPTCTAPSHLGAGEIVVPIVVDFGGAGAKVLVACIETRAGDTGAQILQAQASQLGYSVPRYNDSGLLCAIDGYPANGCGAQAGSHYAYWSYWHGGKSWQYANNGPGEWQVSKGDVEGWRFQANGSASPSDPPPRAASSAAQLEQPAKAAGATSSESRPSANRSSSSGAGAGPVSRNGRHDTAPVPFVLGLALIVLIGGGTLLRLRRTSGRVT